jgi:hypothetical protein
VLSQPTAALTTVGMPRNPDDRFGDQHAAITHQTVSQTCARHRAENGTYRRTRAASDRFCECAWRTLVGEVTSEYVAGLLSDLGVVIVA